MGRREIKSERDGLRSRHGEGERERGLREKRAEEVGRGMQSEEREGEKRMERTIERQGGEAGTSTSNTTAPPLPPPSSCSFLPLYLFCLSRTRGRTTSRYRTLSRDCRNAGSGCVIHFSPLRVVCYFSLSATPL